LAWTLRLRSFRFIVNEVDDDTCAPRRLSTLLARAALVLAVAGSLALPVQQAAGSGATEMLPDLDQAAPGDLSAIRVSVGGNTRFRLGFSSAAENVGRGPLTIHGFRRGTKTKKMQADQLIRQTDGGVRLVRNVGGMVYVVHPDHRHWHSIGFARYEIRKPGDNRPSVRSDRKTGFCLGDRYRAPDAKKLPNFRPFPEQGDTCGLGKPGLTGLFAGISVGYGDRYEANIEGQFVDVTPAPAGNYVLVQTVNPDRKIVESNYDNNQSSTLFSLAWPKGRDQAPAVRVLKTCPSSEECEL